MSLPPEVLAHMQANVDDNKVPDIIASNAICLAIAYVTVALRIVSRNLIRNGLHTNDWCMVAALMFYTGFAVCFCLTTRWGAGRHIILVTNIEVMAKLNLVDEVLYSAVLLAVKYSILALYSCIFPQRWFRNVLIASAAFIGAWFFAGIFSGIFQCVPLRLLWDKSVPGRCINYGKLVLAIGVINVSTDFWLLSIPIPLVWRLHVKRSKKWLITFTFVAGSMACIVSVVRLAFVEKVGSTLDPSWDNIDGGILSTVEISTAILAGNILTFRPLLIHLTRGKMGGSPKDQSSGSYGMSVRSKNPSTQVNHISISYDVTNGPRDDQERLYSQLA